jgi:hypothetical protein
LTTPSSEIDRIIAFLRDDLEQVERVMREGMSSVAPVIPAIMRPMKSQASVGANAITRYSSPKPASEASSTGRRPNRSLRLPTIGAHTNCMAA